MTVLAALLAQSVLVSFFAPAAQRSVQARWQWLADRPRRPCVCSEHLGGPLPAWERPVFAHLAEASAA